MYAISARAANTDGQKVANDIWRVTVGRINKRILGYEIGGEW